MILGGGAGFLNGLCVVVSCPVLLVTASRAVAVAARRASSEPSKLLGDKAGFVIDGESSEFRDREDRRGELEAWPQVCL